MSPSSINDLLFLPLCEIPFQHPFLFPPCLNPLLTSVLSVTVVTLAVPCARSYRIKSDSCCSRSALENAEKASAFVRSPVWTVGRTRPFRRSFAARAAGPACRADATVDPAPSTGSRAPGQRYHARHFFYLDYFALIFWFFFCVLFSIFVSLLWKLVPLFACDLHLKHRTFTVVSIVFIFIFLHCGVCSSSSTRRPLVFLYLFIIF